jgi:hypothetical protein
MDEQTRKVGRNEALFRQVNEEIEALGPAADRQRTLHIVCECGDLRCTENLDVRLNDYERVRANSALFIVLPGHEIPTAEDVVETQKKFYVVRKLEGGPQQLAEETDPRS